MLTAGTTSVSRRLLGRLRDVMAGGGTAQERLDKVVTLIAADMVAEVCSCYVMRAGDILELFSTEGLRKDAVHQTRLRVGEGLVGDIAAHARPLALADAQAHPNFAYRPETGEEIFHSLMGVPIIRGSRVVGVLVVQNRTMRHYTDEEIETLETVAMVLAELVASGELVNRSELVPVDGNALLPLRLEGVKLNGGVGIGIAVLHRPRITIRRLVAEDPDVELERLKKALAGIKTALEELFSRPEMRDGEHRDVLETYRMFTEDKGWINRISEAIRTGLTAEAAVQKVHDDTRARMSQITDPYLRERMHDFEDLANRLLQYLSGDDEEVPRGELPENSILIGRNMGPMELFDYDPKRLRGLVLEEGSATAHVAIVARALDIPVVGRVKDVLDKIEPLDPVICDGDNGQVFIRPPDDIRETFADAISQRQLRKAVYARLRDLPAVTRDGVKIAIHMNAGLLLDLQHLHESGSDGIGLYRTELPFMARSSLPDVAAQTLLYKKIMDQAEGKPVVFRTLDVGGDKVLPYWNPYEEDNPAMGWRSIRITLDRPAVMRHQLRALLRAAAGRELSVMFPMVAEVAELVQARRILDIEIEREAQVGNPLPIRVRVGTMLEVPALALQLDALLPLVDFVSIGTNDLMQFLFAVDRGNPRIAERYDTLAPTMMRFMRYVAAKCREYDVSLSVCGEMAGRPLEAMGLIAVGIRSLSVASPSIGPVKTMVRSLNVEELWSYMETLLDSPDHSLRHKLKNFAHDHGVAL
ncbi:phosphoenolpyruvate--protein phosphotransferase [Paramagnetospirillum kuznetsovii]|uniref:phosphoenolpyruvate--protein phosphotransferase n=1 Tax=Paramagnetospirillum kuznetsovii TaxID=2053833 RepID=A0A364P0W8_9PROT|nr:phosphoenolpyruvate--protein phosphotransferase [Paramagnetospirillum kuznetsovii]RAU22946.1 phosphoenolpyruvate--protein phosphotransferase [Paramagnetospirillum kuznetsovii]